MLFDPICGKQVEVAASTPSVEYKRRKYYFCSARCKGHFAKQAEKIRLNELLRIGALLTSGKVRWGMA